MQLTEIMAIFVLLRDLTSSYALQVLGKASDLGPDSKEGSLEASMVLHSDVKRARLKFSNFKFCPVKGWLTSQIRENVNGMSTTVCLVLPCYRYHSATA
jgi:hypothetical protein